MKWIIDRLEGEFAVIECRKQAFSIPKIILPEDAKEGDVIEVEINKNETICRKNTADKLLDGLFGK